MTGKDLIILKNETGMILRVAWSKLMSHKCTTTVLSVGMTSSNLRNLVLILCKNNPFTQFLRSFILEDVNLKDAFCEKYSQRRYESELQLIKTIYEGNI